MPDVNFYAVLVAALSSFMLGGLWYSPLMFLKPWLRANGWEGPRQGHPAKVFGLGILFSLIAAFTLAVWLGKNPPLDFALSRGAMAGFCFVSTSFGINYQFAMRSTAMLLIDGGYHTLQFVLYGLILGLWH